MPRHHVVDEDVVGGGVSGQEDAVVLQEVRDREGLVRLTVQV